MRLCLLDLQVCALHPDVVALASEPSSVIAAETVCLCFEVFLDDAGELDDVALFDGDPCFVVGLDLDEQTTVA